MGTAFFANMDATRILAFSLHGRQLYPRATQITPDATVRVGHGFCTSWTNRHVIIRKSWTTLVYSTRFPWRPLWGRRGGPEEIGGMLTERQLNGSGELPERWSAKRKTEIVLRLLRGEDLGQISREIQVAPQVIEEWRRAFLAGAEAGLKKRGGDP